MKLFDLDDRIEEIHQLIWLEECHERDYDREKVAQLRAELVSLSNKKKNFS